jgi:hypothetical protein
MKMIRKRGIFTRFGTKMNGIVSPYLDKTRPNRVLTSQVKGLRAPNLAKSLK